MEQQTPKALFTWAAAGAAAAAEVAETYRRAGMAVSLYGEAAEEGLAALGAENGMTHVLHFLDAERLLLVSLADEMGGFTVEVRRSDLLLP